MNFFEKAQARAHAQEVLGLTGHAEHDEIRAAYKKLAREKHPDNGGSDDEFAKINEAYSLLIDDEGYSSKDRLRHAPSDSSATTRKRSGRSSASHTQPASRSSGSLWSWGSWRRRCSPFWLVRSSSQPERSS